MLWALWWLCVKLLVFFDVVKNININMKGGVYMKAKIKKIVYGASSLLMAAPVMVSAYDAPAGTTLPTGSITGIITNIMQWLLGLVGLFGVIGFAIAGILYLTAAGDEGRIGQAKNAMVWSIVGVVVALLGVVIITAVNSMLGAQETAF